VSGPAADLPRTPAEFARRAKELLPGPVYDYLVTGAADEITLEANAAAWRNIALRQKILIDVSGLDTSVTLLGRRRPHPFASAPTAWQTLAHPGGEAELARGMAAGGGIYVLSCWSSQPMREVAEAAPDSTRWFHLHLFTDRAFTLELAEEAAELGFEALVLTVDQPVAGYRYRTMTGQFARPEAVIVKGRDAGLDGTITWDDVAELARSVKLPLLAKGVLDPGDARLAVEAGLAGVIVSNHGARQLDTVLPTAAVLPLVADAVNGEIDVLVDGGICRGTDAVKALALGASGILVGRQMLWALACGGAPAAQRGLELLVAEFGTALAIMGCTRAEDLDRSALLPAPWAGWSENDDNRPGRERA
jgi:isopentenyl diphosphate isomerase/L-lactate dehydrogenase-like FMN-dependent dehydrogenase